MTDSTRFIPRGRVIPAAELGVITDATRLQQQARQAAREQAERVRDIEAQARARAENEGLQAGREQALRTLSMAISDIRTRLLSRENELAQVVVAAVERIIGEVPADERVRGAVRKALEDLADQTNVVLAVCPEERQTIATALADMSLMGTLKDIRADASLSPGDMVLEAGHARYNIGLKTQLQRLADGMRAGALHP